jgi:hypothetical protein
MLPTPRRRAVNLRRARPEQEIQRALFQHLAIRAASSVFGFHPANGGWRTATEAAILKGMGVRAGIPDIIIIHAGKCYALELKAPGGRLTPVQRVTHAALAAAGATVAVAYGLDDALARLEGWGLLRGSCQDVAPRRPRAGPEMAAGASGQAGRVLPASFILRLLDAPIRGIALGTQALSQSAPLR